MNKSAKQSKQTELKSPINRSHNQGSQLFALVESIARNAAEEKFKAEQAQIINQTIEGEEQ